MERRVSPPSASQAALVSLLAATADIDEVVGVILSEAVRLASADRCLLALPGDSARHLDVAELRAPVTGTGEAPAIAGALRWSTIPLSSESPLSEVVRTGHMVVPTAAGQEPEDRSGSVAAFPMDPSTGALGAISFEWSGGLAPHASTLDGLSGFAKLAGLAVERTRLRARERHLTRVIRGALLGPLETGRRVEAVGSYHPPWSGVPLGGDWYDAFTTPDGRVVFVLGDVTGHGVDASPTMLSARTFVRAFMFEEPDPSACLRKLDDAWATFRDSTGMVSVLLAVFDQRDDTLRWVNAGLPAPLVRRSTGEVTELAGARARPAGSGLPRATGVPETVDLRPGDVFVAYTDGFVLPSEAGGTDPASITAAVVEHGGGSLRALITALAGLGGEGEFRTDDASVLAVRIRRREDV